MRKALESLPGVKTVTVNMPKKEASVVVTRSKDFSEENFVKMANKTRYSFKLISSKKAYSTPSPLVQGKDLLKQFAKDFNKDKSQIRFIALLSASDRELEDTLKRIHKTILKEYPESKIQLQLVWTQLKGDTLESTDEIARNFSDVRTLHYWDPNQEIIDLIKEPLGLEKEKELKNVFLFYASGSEWKSEEKLSPSHWGHQIAGIAKEQYYREKKIEKFMEESLKTLLTDMQ